MLQAEISVEMYLQKESQNKVCSGKWYSVLLVDALSAFYSPVFKVNTTN